MNRLEYERLNHKGDYTELIINRSNDFYRDKKLALISKIPVPVKVIKRKGGMIVSAFFEEKGILDYCGVVQGLPVSFDSKETVQPSFPLSNIAEHQYNYMDEFNAQRGYSFIICHFVKSGTFYLLTAEYLSEWRERARNGGRKSIPEKDIPKKYEIKYWEKQGVLDYLPVLNLYWNERELKDKKEA